MDKLEVIKKKLIGHKIYLEETIAKGYKDNDQDDQGQDLGDQATAAILEELNRSIHHNELDEYNMVLKALERIESGDYGNCIECDNPISEKRLFMFPNATRCLICQEALEESKL